MINLLPEQMKEDYRYARRNTSLLHYLTMFGFGLIGLVLISAAGAVYLMQNTHTYSKQAASIQQSLHDQKQTEVEKQVQDMSSSLKLAVQVLSQEVLFSQLLKQLAVVTPSNTSLSNLSISQLQGSVDITARTIDYRAATQLQVNLADPANKIFGKADIMNITCNSTSTGAGSSKYPCAVTIRALFATNNPFLFINNKTKAAK
jgi:Tfp pilus assembly protein PilN